MLPLVRAPPKDQCVLLPDAAPGEVKAHGVKRAAEDQALGIRVEHIDAAVIRQVVMHTAHGLLGKLVCFLIRKVVILDRPGSPLIGHEVGKIGQDQIRFHAVQHFRIAFHQGRVPAEDFMLSQHPQVAGLGKHRLLQLRFHIEIIFLDFLAVYLVEQGLNLRRVKARLAKVKIAVLDILQQIRQKGIIPCTGDLVEGDIQRFLPGLVDVHHGAGYFRVAHGNGNIKSLMSADDRHVGVDHQRVSESELFNGIFDFFVLLIPRL